MQISSLHNKAKNIKTIPWVHVLVWFDLKGTHIKDFALG
jgi:hypothetical protein